MVMISLLTQFSEDMAEVHEGAAHGLVQIRRGGRSIGAGTVWHPSGLVLTNAHVVDSRVSGRQSLTVLLEDGREAPAQVLVADGAADLAALRVDVAGLAAIPLGDSRALRAGQLVLAFGFPYGVTSGATIGSVIDLVREDGSAQGRREWLAAGLHLRPGHSGGPMVDAMGRLVGINTMMNGPDVGVAIPVHVASDFLRRTLGSIERTTSDLVVTV